MQVSGWQDRQASLTEELVLMLTAAMDLDDGKKLYHSWRVAIIAANLARRVTPAAEAGVFLAGLLHEVGSIGAPMHILHYASKPTVDPRSEPAVFQHPYYGAEFLRHIAGLRGRYFISDIVVQHHENWDGSGYPNGLRGDEIHPAGLLVRAADQIDTFEFSTHGQLTAEELVERLRAGGYAPNWLSDHMVEVLREGDLLAALRAEREIEARVDAMFSQYRDALFETEVAADASESLFTLIAKVIDRKHNYTQGHSGRVAAYAAQIAQAMGLPADQVRLARYGGFVHDIGKIGVPRSLLDSTERLGSTDWELMKRHAELSYELLTAFPTLRPYAFSALHHERWDGKGYPLGLAGERIPLLARVITVADALDGMTSQRSYRPVWTMYRALAELRDKTGSQFDPVVVEAAFACFHDAGANADRREAEGSADTRHNAVEAGVS